VLPWLPLPTSPESTPRQQPPPLATFKFSALPRFLSKELLSALSLQRSAFSRLVKIPARPRCLATARTAAFFALLAWLNCQAIDTGIPRKVPEAGDLSLRLPLGIIGILLAAILSPFQPRPQHSSGRLCRRPASRVLTVCEPPYALALRACADLRC